jgi:hypothetical protein
MFDCVQKLQKSALFLKNFQKKKYEALIIKVDLLLNSVSCKTFEFSVNIFAVILSVVGN